MIVFLLYHQCFSWIYTIKDSYKKENDYYNNNKKINL